MRETLRGATIAQARRHVAEQLHAAGIETPALDARVLIGHALGLDHAALASAASRELASDAVEQIARLAARRLAGEPVARIIGEKEFWGLPFKLAPAVLVPRPETETVVELALALIDRNDARAGMSRIADLGTGSGALLLALLSELAHAHGIGTDIDPAALAVARANARRLELDARTAFIESNYGAALTGPFDFIVSNPPYVATGDIAALAREVREHDPRHALDGGADGLAAYRAIASDAPRLLAPDGCLVVEIGAGQSQDIEFLLAEAGLAIVERKPDLSGVMRALAARRAA